MPKNGVARAVGVCPWLIKVWLEPLGVSMPKMGVARAVGVWPCLKWVWQKL